MTVADELERLRKDDEAFRFNAVSQHFCGQTMKHDISQTGF
jgi:hypothetical protein